LKIILFSFLLLYCQVVNSDFVSELTVSARVIKSEIVNNVKLHYPNNVVIVNEILKINGVDVSVTTIYF
jgi:hypothetical protein